MKKKIKYTDEPIGDVEILKDFLPPPEQLVFNEENIIVTLKLKKSSVEFFKNIAKNNGVQYQKVMRNLLDRYASTYSHSN